MGLLDDAIREHLELKRRHGADPSEVERQEQEALGPPRRGEPVDELDAPAAVSVETADDDGLLDDPYEDEPYDDEPYDDEPPAAPAAAMPAPSTPAAEPEAPVAPPVEEDDDDEPVEPPRRAAAEEEPGAAPEEDVLEETPEFLQETPEHDRLWFEQKPPRDFEF